MVIQKGVKSAKASELQLQNTFFQQPILSLLTQQVIPI